MRVGVFMTVKIKEWNDCNRQECQTGSEVWTVPRLIQLSKDLPVEEIPLRYIGLCNRYFSDLTLRGFVTHMKAVLNADLSCPIILGEDGEIMDGRHRITKALYEGKETILAVRFDANPPPCRIEHDS